MSSSESSNKTQIPPASRIRIKGPPEKPSQQAQSLTIAQLKAVTDHVNPFCDAEEQDQAIKALHHETNGSDEGMALADAWSRKGDNYPGADALASTWRSYSDSNDEPETSGTLRKMVEDNGFDWGTICNPIESDTETCDLQLDKSNEQSAVTSSVPQIPFVKHSLQGMSEQLATEISDQVPLLGPIILMFQSSVIYAAPNTGKTLIILWLLVIAIKQGKIDPSRVFYFNLDDTPNGLIEKLILAEEYRFHVLAEGYNDFKADALLVMLAELVDNDRAKGIIIILDTLKKFTDLMDKRMSSRFGKAIRNFVMRGGTCISLAHTNKHRNSDGKPVYAGTTDIIDDADCAYLMYEVGIDADAETKTIQFENIKSRGSVARQVAYRYSISEGLSYRDLFDSVKPVDDTEVSSLKQTVELESDTGLIDVVTACIREGINTKMRMAEAASERSGASKRAVLRLVEKYSGSDPDTHIWNFQVLERGAKKYCLLTPDTTVSDPVVKL